MRIVPFYRKPYYNRVMNIRRLTLIVSILLVSVISHLSAFQFEPITQDFTASGSGTRQSFVIRNPNESPIAVKISMVHRDMDEVGKETLTDASGLFFVYPTQVLVPPGGVQTVRVQWLGKPELDEEQPFRIIAEQLPIQVTQSGSGVNILIAYHGSIYVLPKDIAFNVELVSIERAMTDDSGATKSSTPPKLRIELANTGNSHMLLINPVLLVESRSSSGSVISRLTLRAEELEGLSGENILAGKHRVFLVPWPEGLIDGELDATFTVEPTR